MHSVAARVLRLHRQEGPGTDMEGERLAADTALLESLQQPRREMKRRSGRGHGTFLAREHGLVIGVVLSVRGPFRGNIGGKRHTARPLEQDLDRLLTVEVEQRRPIVRFLDDGRVYAATEVDQVADPCPLRIAKERLPLTRTFALV